MSSFGQYDESKHARGKDGKFAAKSTSESDMTLMDTRRLGPDVTPDQVHALARDAYGTSATPQEMRMIASLDAAAARQISAHMGTMTTPERVVTSDKRKAIEEMYAQSNGLRHRASTRDRAHDYVTNGGNAKDNAIGARLSPERQIVALGIRNSSRNVTHAEAIRSARDMRQDDVDRLSQGIDSDNDFISTRDYQSAMARPTLRARLNRLLGR